MNLLRTLIAAAALMLAGSAFAQQTIDHNKALAGNVTPGDTAGYPITLSQPGHYKLMGNLVVPANTTGILITASDVTLDLNGFTVAGPVTCSRNSATKAVTCSQGSNLDAPDGVRAHHSVTGNTVRNGTVRGFAGIGIYQVETVENVRATQNGGYGIGAGSSKWAAEFRDSVGDLNGIAGFVAQRALIVRSRASANGSYGFYSTSLQRSVVVLDSYASENANYGLQGVTAGRTGSFDNGPSNDKNRNGVTSLGGNLDGTTVY